MENVLNDIIIENRNFRLTVGSDCMSKSLVLKTTGEELLCTEERLSLFSLTEPRPFNNEIKLAHPNKRTVFQANSLQRDGNTLTVGFELIKFKALVEIKEADGYVSFTLKDFLVEPEHFHGLAMTPPPVSEFRLLQLPVKDRENFGEWLNVSHDDNGAVNVLATDPFARIDSEKRKGFRIMYAEALKDIKLKRCSAALIVSDTDKLLDCIDSLEEDFGLPRGVRSRRSKHAINSSVYWVGDLNPGNIERHLHFAKKGGLKMMLIAHTSFFKERPCYQHCGDCYFNENYPNGIEDLKKVIERLKDEGITPGFHFLHTHIGISSQYVTPVADHRLNLTRYFTLARPLSETDETVYVEQNPESSVMHPDARVLKFGGECIRYEGYSTEYPYCFTGCKRGHYSTNVSAHGIGTIGGLLDVSEYSATSVYVDQRTSLQDEIAEKLAKIYDLGFEFIYFDGSEGTHPLYEIYVPYAQYRVYRKLGKEPLFCEGAAKAHFSWHMITGGNAFDTFPMEIFKQKIVEHPLEEAKRMANDFTRVNFGWWNFNQATQPDIYEYGTSKAASQNCPGTVQGFLYLIDANERRDDIFEVIRRWEDARRMDLFTDEQKKLIADPDTEYTLLINEDGEYELTPYYKIENAANGNELISAFYFERRNKSYVVCWHKTGSGELNVPLKLEEFDYERELGGEKETATVTGNGICLSVSGKRYFSADISREEIVCAFKNAELKV